jgi:hypothetical protein
MVSEKNLRTAGNCDGEVIGARVVAAGVAVVMVDFGRKRD